MTLSVANQYTDNEIDAILQKALEAGDTDLGLTHEELADVAAQVGITTEQLEQAAEQVRTERAGADDLAAAKAEVAKRTRRRRRGWLQHFFTYGVVIAGLAALDFVTGGGMTWWFYPAVGWGMAVALQAVGVLMYDEDRDLERQLRRIRKRRERLEREARRKKHRAKHGGTLEEALERGVALLLTTAAEKLASKMAAGTPLDTDFGRFVAKKKGIPTRVESPQGQRPGVRVASSEEVEVVESAARRRQREAER